jgi:hypothetical protein
MITTVMAIGASSFLAPTAPAIEAELHAGPIDHEEGQDRNDRGLQDRDRTGPNDQCEGQRRAEQHDAGLDVELNAEAGIEPARQADDV